MLPRGMHYRRILGLSLLITCIPGLVISGMIYWFFTGRIESELLKQHTEQMAKRAEHVQGQFDQMELMLARLAFDPKLDYNLRTTDFQTQFTVTRDLTKTMLLTRDSMPLIQQTELYVQGIRPVRFIPDYDGRIPVGQQEDLQQLLGSENSMAWTNLMPPDSGKAQGELSLVHQIPGGAADPFGLLVFRLDPVKVAKLLQTLTPDGEGESFLMKEDGTVLFTSGGSSKLSAAAWALRSAVLERSGDSSSFLLEWGGHNYSVSTGTFGRVGSRWTYVSAAPTQTITAPVVALSRMILFVSLSGLGLAAALAWVASRRIYSPLNGLISRLAGARDETDRGGPSAGRQDEFELIEQHWTSLNRESSELQRRLQEQLPQVGQGFLLQLIQGHLSAYSEQDLLERMRTYGWPPELTEFTVLYVRLTGMSRLETAGRFKRQDEGLLTFAAANMLQELAEERFGYCRVMSFHDLSAALLIGLPQGAEPSQSLRELGGNASERIQQLLNLQATVCIGPAVASVQAVPGLFEQLKSAASMRQMDHGSVILDLETIRSSAEGDTPMRYPFAEERELLQAIRRGSREEAENCLDTFLQALSDSGTKEKDFQQGILNLLGSLQHMMLQSSVQPRGLSGPQNPFAELFGLCEVEPVRAWFLDRMILPYMDEMEQRSEGQIQRMIEQALAYIEANYMEDLSLESCAEHCGVNVFLLSRSFKPVTGQTFIDCLTEVRMNKARELLRESECRMNEVAARVGYQQGYFNRIFKKVEGITPSQYRERSRAAEG